MENVFLRSAVKKMKIRYDLSLFATLLLLSCATQRPPIGGPEDKEPPSIVSTEPASGKTRFEGREIKLIFSEYVDRQSFQKAVHLSPYMPGAPGFDWSGKEVTVTLPSEPLPDRSYVLSVGTTVRDVNAGNTMKENFSLAFSTGDSLDMNRISGRVFDANAGGISIFAYKLESSDTTTIYPALHNPDYLVQTSPDGMFDLRYLASGQYRVFAVRDKQSNVHYDPQTDDIGIPTRDVEAVHDSIRERYFLRFRLMREDTTAPFIQRVTALTHRSIEVVLSEESDTVLSADHFTIIDSTSSTRIPIDVLVFDGNKRSTYTLLLRDTIEEKPYSLTATNIRDAFGNVLQSIPIGFVGTNTPDTMKPSIHSISPKSREKYWPGDSSLSIVFSRRMSSVVGVEIKDSTNASVVARARWLSGNELQITPGVPLKQGTQYRLCVDLNTARDSLRNIAVGDSIQCFEFRTETDAEYGSITGTVVDAVDSLSKKNVTVIPSDRNQTTRQVPVKRSGQFEVTKLLPGTYVLEAFSDRDGDKKFSHGRIAPFLPSERFGIASDTVRVRARWETSGVRITIPE